VELHTGSDRVAVYCTAAATVSFAERLNGILNANWRQFAKQPYFDRQGIFFSVLVSAPLLITMFFLLVSPSLLSQTPLVFWMLLCSLPCCL